MARKKIKLQDLSQDDKNANRGTVRGSGMLERSLREYGAGRSLVCDKNGRLISGNKTAEALEAVGIDDLIVVETDGTKAVVVKRMDLDLDSPEARGLAIADNRVGQINLDWDLDMLNDLGASVDLSQFWFDGEEDGIDIPIDVDDDIMIVDDLVSTYTKKIDSPVYEPTGERPQIRELVDAEVTVGLLDQIEEADIPEEVKAFLRLAAQRHLRFDYENIAEYYAHAPKPVQALMEQSALVIIDFKQAIENGFVKLSSRLAEAYDK